MCIGQMFSNWRPKKAKTKRKAALTNFERFLQKEVPIIMVMGPEHCGKSTISDMLKVCSQFTLVRVVDLLREEMKKRTIYGERVSRSELQGEQVTDRLVVKILKDEIVSSYINTKGFILDGFPCNMTQAVLFKHNVCRPNCIVYLYLNLDSLFARMVNRHVSVDLDNARIRYIHQMRDTEAVYAKYDDFTFKQFNCYPPEHTCNKIIEHLEDYYGFKFIRIGL